MFSDTLTSSETVTLRDGSTVRIRPIRPDDAHRLQAAFNRLSPESIRFRFLVPVKILSDPLAESLANVDYHTRMALVGTDERDGEECINAVARYAVPPGAPPDVADFAIVVEDRYQRHGLGAILFKRLVAYARAHGIRTFTLTTAIENRRMLRLLERSGLETKQVGAAPGVLEISVDLESGT